MSKVTAATKTNSTPQKDTVITAQNLSAIVTHVDSQQAVLKVTHPTSGELEAHLSKRTVLRKSSGFGSVVEYVDDFISVSDEVYVNIKKEKKKWSVTRVSHRPFQRPLHYNAVQEYFKRKPPAHWPQPAHSHIPYRKTGEIVSIIHDILRRWNKVPIRIFLDAVEKSADDHNNVFESYIKTENALRSFLRTVPQYFALDEDNRVCMHQGFTKEQFQSAITTKCMTFPWKTRRFSLDDVRTISSVRQSYAVLGLLLNRAEEKQISGHNPGLVVALDCEGVNLGKTGKLTLVQVSTMEGLVYLFDVMLCPSIFDDGLLADFLESDAVLKVIHDCRKDSAALYHQYGVTLTNIFDTSIAYNLLQDQCQMEGGRLRERIGFKHICEMVGETVEHKNKKFHKKMVYTQLWGKRPLSQPAIRYAAADVYLLLPNVYRAFDRLIHPHWQKIFRFKCENAIQMEIMN